MNARAALLTVLSCILGAAAAAGVLAWLGRESMLLALAAGAPVGLGCRFAFGQPARFQVVIGLAGLVAVAGGIMGGYAVAYETQLSKAIDRAVTPAAFADDQDAAKAYAKHDTLKGDATFMASFGYGTKGDTADAVTPTELTYFETYTAPLFRWMTETSPDLAAWQAKKRPNFEAMARAEITVMTLAMGKRDWIDTGLIALLAIALAIGLAVGNPKGASADVA